MCGIAGIVQLDGSPADAGEVRKMLDRIRHRGPDDSGAYSEGAVALGNVRLSIIDLSAAGHQPMLSNDGRYVLTYNGEIYNYRELRKELESRYTFRSQTDSEVLLAAFTVWGEECLHRFNGMFAFAIYDCVNKEVFAARDRFGIKPFYYWVGDDRLVFASEMRAVMAVLDECPVPNDRMIHDYLVYHRTDHTSETFIEGIRSLPHGHTLAVRDGRMRLTRWYDLSKQQAARFHSSEEYKSLLSSAVGLRLRSDVPVGVCLSGGLDSSSIVSILLREHQNGDLMTFSAAYQKGEVGDESSFREPFRGSCNMFETYPTADTLHDDLEQLVQALGEPVPSSSPYAQYKVMELASRRVTVLLDGQGADEQLAGYHYFFGHYFVELLRSFQIVTLLGELVNYVRQHRSAYGLGAFGFLLLPTRLQNAWRTSRADYVAGELLHAWPDGSPAVNELHDARSLRRALLNHFEYKLEHLLKWEDRNSMWFSLEARVPFLDHRLVEKTLVSPSSDLISGGRTKQRWCPADS